MLKVQPRLTDLKTLVAKVDTFPVTTEELVYIAHDKSSHSDVIEFYKTFPADEIFESKEDLLARTEQVALMNQDHDQPKELWLAPEED